MSEKIQNAVVAQEKKAPSMVDYVKKFEPEIKKALPAAITPERFTRMVLTAISVNPKLAQCTPKSFLGAMMNAAQLGVEPNTPLGQAYLIPYKNKGVDEVQFQLGYKGLIDLAYRSGNVDTIQAQVVYENDRFEYEYGIDPKLKHIPTTGDRGKMTHVYAVIKMKDGGYTFDVMTVEDIKKHAEKYSQASRSSYSPWASSFEEMAKKTVLKRVLKYAPLKSDFQRGIAQDETIKVDISADMSESVNVIDGEGEIIDEGNAES